MLSLLVLTVSAVRSGTSGAGGCGGFADGIAKAQEGDIIIPMIPERNSGSALLDQRLTILGGWFPTNAVCEDLNQTFESEEELLAAGFTFDPNTPSGLRFDGDPGLRIGHTGVMTITNMALRQEGTVFRGGGSDGFIASGIEDGHLIMNRVSISDSFASNGAGGIDLEVRQGAKLSIVNSKIFDNSTGGDGGGFFIDVQDQGEVVLQGTEVRNNSSLRNGGGGVIIARGRARINIINSRFVDNTAGPSYSNSAALQIRSLGSGPVYVCMVGNTFANNGPTNPQGPELCGNGIIEACPTFLPVLTRAAAPSPYARITNITTSGTTYNVFFNTVGFTPQLPGVHLHFFFDTVPPEQAGVPGSGPWKLYGGSSPFTGYRTYDRPGAAQKMCVLVANANHSIRLNTGNCYPLP